MRITTIARRTLAPTSAVVKLSADRAPGNLLWDDPEKQEREQDETDFEKIHRFRCDAVHVCVFRDDSARRSGR